MIGSIASPVQVVNDLELREQPRTSLNRLCNMVDWHTWNPLSNVIRELNDSPSVHRKVWEYAMCVLGLRHFDLIQPYCRALAVGAGCERPLFYFANHIREMVATDLYDENHPESRPAMLTNPEQFSPFEYRRDRLRVLRMAGDDLQFADESFDFVFCLSSIEHFGSSETQKRAMSEISRVLRPNGIAAIATELILNNGTHPECFTYAQLADLFFHCPRLVLVGGELDLRIAKSLVDYPTMIDTTKNPDIAPHIVLYSNGVMWTSVMLFLQRL